MIITKKSKKERIRELMDTGKTAKEIANMLGTSESYVNKVKSNWRTESSISTDSNSGEMAITNNNDVGVTNRQRKVRSRNGQLSLMTPAMRKSFYRWLDAKKPLVDFIKRTGVDGRVLDEEYGIYLKLKDADRFELQKRLLALVEVNENEKEAILSEPSSNLLSNTALVNHLKKRIDENKDWWVERMIKKYSTKEDSVLPFGFERPNCRNCRNPVMGLLIYKRFKEDPDLLNHLNSICLCTVCRQSTRRLGKFSSEGSL